MSQHNSTFFCSIKQPIQIVKFFKLILKDDRRPRLCHRDSRVEKEKANDNVVVARSVGPKGEAETRRIAKRPHVCRWYLHSPSRLHVSSSPHHRPVHQFTSRLSTMHSGVESITRPWMHGSGLAGTFEILFLLLSTLQFRVRVASTNLPIYTNNLRLDNRYFVIYI